MVFLNFLDVLECRPQLLSQAEYRDEGKRAIIHISPHHSRTPKDEFKWILGTKTGNSTLQPLPETSFAPQKRYSRNSEIPPAWQPSFDSMTRGSGRRDGGGLGGGERDIADSHQHQWDSLTAFSLSTKSSMLPTSATNRFHTSLPLLLQQLVGLFLQPESRRATIRE